MPYPRRFHRCGLVVVALVALVSHAPAQIDDACGASPSWLAHDDPLVAAPAPAAPIAPALRVVTYNVHSGLGRRHAFHRSRAVVERHLLRIARAIAASAPPESPVDFVGLNEVDFGARRSGRFDQATFVADELGRLTGASYHVVRGETWRRTLPGFDVRFGNAVLTRHPVVRASTCMLDGTDDCISASGDPAAGETAELPPLRSRGWIDRLLHEARGVIRLSLAVAPSADAAPFPVDVLVTHLDAFVQSEREAQAAWLIARFVRSDRATILLGDVNAVPTALTGDRRFFRTDRTHDVLTSGALADARIVYAGARGIRSLAEWATFPSDRPVWPLDVVLGSLDLVPTDLAVIGDAAASDHRGFSVRYAFGSEAERAAARLRHDAMRRRQVARITACDLVGPAFATRGWLLSATGFASLLPL